MALPRETFTASDRNVPEGEVFFDQTTSAGGGAATLDGTVQLAGNELKHITHSVLYTETSETWTDALEFDEDGELVDLTPEETALLAAAGAEYNRRGNGIDGTLLFRNTH